MNDRYALRGLIFTGAIAVVLAAAPYRAFDLDRFFAPKELALHAVTLALVLLVLRRVKTLEFSLVDLLVAAYLALSLASTLAAADHWLAARALAVTLSGAGVFWAARAAAGAGERRAIVAAVAGAAVLGAAASLAQAYGVSSDLFSLHRVPGGTLGNRNFMAHLAVICAPALVLAAVKARRSWTAAAGAAGLALIADALVLSRSRAALLGLLAGAVILACGYWRARGRWSGLRTAFRLKLLLLAAASGVLAALLLPNTLEWKSDSPYLDTVTGVVNYQKGSGHGRLVQYGRTLRIAAAHPLLGVGPGNWALAYPKFVDGFDPSIDYYYGLTINPWPSSDWMAIASERGFPALAASLLVFAVLLAGAWRRAAGAAGPDEYLEGLTLASAVAATAVVACFDAVLLLPAPTFLAWALFGALAAPSPALRTVAVSPRARRRLAGAAAFIGLVVLLRSSGQVAAMRLFSKARSTAQIAAAARLDPGNLKIRARLADLQGGRD
ncbi:MAG: O-antigen ligase family protein [Elusimicrobiales bacterium]|nr:O-antigen ligase family protein [Elusimicrobiales bacterium]